MAIYFGSESSDALDTYDMGNWTPTINPGFTVGYSTQIGRYTKIGDLVYFTWLNDYPDDVLGGNYNKNRTWEMEFNCKNKTLKVLDTLNGGFNWESWDSKRSGDDSWILAGNFVCKR